MPSKTVVGALISSVAVLFCVALTAGQGQSVPGIGNGIVTVRGAVDVRNKPEVSATQAGDWKVTVVKAPPITVAPLDFLKKGGRYEITWTGGERETIEVAAFGPGGWVWLAGANRRQRWINLDVARSVEEAP